MGKGKGFFEFVINFGVGEGFNIVVVEDFNNDGKKDIVVINSEVDIIFILINISKIVVVDFNIIIFDIRIIEGNKGRKNVKFIVIFDDVSNKIVKVNYVIVNSSVKVGKDYWKIIGIFIFKFG